MGDILNVFDLNSSKINQTGLASVGYPQICLRTNRTAKRTNLDDVIKMADNIANKYPGDKAKSAFAVLSSLSELFGGGSFGHAWLIIFHSDKPGDYSSYSYHDGYGYVHNGDTGAGGHTNDTASRGFAYQHVKKINPEMIQALEKVIIPTLNGISTAIGASFGVQPASGRTGVYTATTNCSWFAGNVWNAVTNETVIFTQNFVGKEHANKWGVDALYLINEIADPGMIAESLNW